MKRFELEDILNNLIFKLSTDLSRFPSQITFGRPFVRSSQCYQLINIILISRAFNIVAGDQSSHRMSRQINPGNSGIAFHALNFVFQDIGCRDVAISPFIGKFEKIFVFFVSVFLKGRYQIIIGMKNRIKH